jgi:hypothetical protein
MFNLSHPAILPIEQQGIKFKEVTAIAATDLFRNKHGLYFWP